MGFECDTSTICCLVHNVIMHCVEDLHIPLENFFNCENFLIREFHPYTTCRSCVYRAKVVTH